MPEFVSHHDVAEAAPLVRAPQTLPKVLAPAVADRLVAALRRHRAEAMVLAMLLAELRRCWVLGLGLPDVWVGDWRTEGLPAPVDRVVVWRGLRPARRRARYTVLRRR